MCFCYYLCYNRYWKDISVLSLDLDSYIKVLKVFRDDWPALLTFLTWLHNHDREGDCSWCYCYPLPTLKVFLIASVMLHCSYYGFSLLQGKRVILLIAGYNFRYLLLLLHLWYLFSNTRQIHHKQRFRILALVSLKTVQCILSCLSEYFPEH